MICIIIDCLPDAGAGQRGYSMTPVKDVLLAARIKFHDLLSSSLVQMAAKAVTEDDIQHVSILTLLLSNCSSMYNKACIAVDTSYVALHYSIVLNAVHSLDKYVYREEQILEAPDSS